MDCLVCVLLHMGTHCVCFVLFVWFVWFDMFAMRLEPFGGLTYPCARVCFCFCFLFLFWFGAG